MGKWSIKEECQHTSSLKQSTKNFIFLMVVTTLAHNAQKLEPIIIL
jgi:hypothetical protein